MALLTLVMSFAGVYPIIAPAGVMAFYSSWWVLKGLVHAAEIGGRTKRWHVQGARGVPLFSLLFAMLVSCFINGMFFQTSDLKGYFYPYARA